MLNAAMLNNAASPFIIYPIHSGLGLGEQQCMYVISHAAPMVWMEFGTTHQLCSSNLYLWPPGVPGGTILNRN